MLVRRGAAVPEGLGFEGREGRATDGRGREHFRLDFVCVGEGECGERERRVPR